jgi:GTPase SAR1 family protein
MASGINYKVVIVGEQFVGKSSIFLRQQKGLFEPDKATASMGAHFAQKIVEIEKEAVPRDSMKSSLAGMEFNHLNESKADVQDSVGPNNDHATLTGKYLSAEAQGTT